MNNELLAVVEHMERERGISRETLLTAIESAVLGAAKKSVSPAQELRIVIDRKTYDFKAFAQVTVVEKVTLPHDEISLTEAKRRDPEAKLGDVMEIEVTPRNFGRIHHIEVEVGQSIGGNRLCIPRPAQ